MELSVCCCCGFVVSGAVVGPGLGSVCVCVCVFWGEALKAADCESVVAEHARLIGFG